MNALVSRLSRLYNEGHAIELNDLRNDERFADGPHRDAAVLVAMTDRARPGFLLTHRPSNMRAHPGQVAFPGGKLDPGEGPVEAAIREANEELGIASHAVTVIGTSDLYRTGTGYAITPVLAVVPPDLPIYPNPAEVADWFEVPVEWAFDRSNHRQQEVEWNGRMRNYIEMDFEGHHIWGVTAAIIENLSRRIAW